MVILELYVNPGSVSFQRKKEIGQGACKKKKRQEIVTMVAIVRDFSLVIGKS